jgi:hypothetical protein
LTDIRPVHLQDHRRKTLLFFPVFHNTPFRTFPLDLRTTVRWCTFSNAT